MPVTETQVIGILLLLISILAGWGFAEHQRRISRLEDHATAHDRWAGAKAEEIATLTELARNVLQRLDRFDGRLDRIEGKIDRQQH